MSAQDELAALQALESTELAKRPDALRLIVHELGGRDPARAEAAAALLDRMVRSHRLRPQHTKNGFPEDACAALAAVLMHGKDPRWRRIAADSLREAEQVAAMDSFLHGLADLDGEVRAACVQALKRLRWRSEHVAPLAGLLSNARAEVRRAALAAIPAHIERSLLASLVPALVARLEDEDEATRMQAAYLLEGQGTRPDAIWPVAIAMAEAGDAYQRAAAVRLMEAHGAPEPAEVAALLRAFADSEPEVRSEAATAAAAVAHSDDRVSQAVVAALGDPHPLVRRAAVFAASARVLDPATCSAMIRLAADKEQASALRIGACEALAAQSVTAAIPTLTDLCSTDERAVAEAAIDALAAFGPSAHAAGTALVALLAHEELALPAAAALLRIGVYTEAAREALKALLQSADDWNRQVAEALLASVT